MGNTLLSLKNGMALLAVTSLMTLISSSNSANAACSTCGTYQSALEQEFNTHEEWMINTWWGDYVEPSLKKMTDDIRNAVTFEIGAFGSFLDAQNQMAAQRTLQEFEANTMKNYAVSDKVCEFGTLSRSLARSESKAKANQLVLAERSLVRQMRQHGTVAMNGPQEDRSERFRQFRTSFCDPADFNSAMGTLCEGTTPDTRRNIDINYARAVDTKRSLDIDFTDGQETDDEKNIMALAQNLYANQIFNPVPTEQLKQEKEEDVRSAWLDQRAIVAKRSVAENSFNAIVSKKARGEVGSREYLLRVLERMGLSRQDAEKYATQYPSYDAQMEVLTKKLYQDPSFYANLMESPANVNRQYVALQSFGLMQKRDIFETITRSEMLMSLLLEMEVSKYQDDVQNRQNTQ